MYAVIYYCVYCIINFPTDTLCCNFLVMNVIWQIKTSLTASKSMASKWAATASSRRRKTYIFGDKSSASAARRFFCLHFIIERNYLSIFELYFWEFKSVAINRWTIELLIVNWIKFSFLEMLFRWCRPDVTVSTVPLFVWASLNYRPVVFRANKNRSVLESCVGFTGYQNWLIGALYQAWFQEGEWPQAWIIIML